MRAHVARCVRLETQEPDARGVFATVDISAGEVVHALQGPVSDTPTRHSIRVGERRHVIDVLGQFVNHSFSPSVVVRDSQLIALRDLVSGDEITFDYNTTESPMACPFECESRRVAGNPQLRP